MKSRQPVHSMRIAFLPTPPPAASLPVVVALLAFVAVVSSLDPAGDYPNAPQGPGLTIDETFNVQQGVRLVEGMRLVALGAITLRELFGDEDDLGDHAPFGYHLPDHPPLGRVWIGLSHHLARALFPPTAHESPFATVCARTAPATAFALTVFLIGWTAARWYATAAGLTAALAVVLMPRLFGHAHLAALETFIGLAYAASVLAVAAYWPRTGTAGGLRPAAPSLKAASLTGIVFGLALLTKIQAVLIPIPVAVWAVFHWRAKALLPLLVWGGVGSLVFFLFWPWLWLDPLTHVQEYLGRTTERIQLHTWYFGERYADRNVPWHYATVLFLTTVPVGLHLLGGYGLCSGERRAWLQPREQVVLGGLLFPLVLFSLPGIAVYDGARLFLVVFPLWAIFIGRGAAGALGWLRTKFSERAAVGLLALFLALQGIGVLALRPCYLSYYNLAVGGLWGAERLGLEPTYWGDSVTRDFLKTTTRALPPGATLHVAPVLHQFQLEEMLRQSPLLRHAGIRLRPFPAEAGEPAEYILLFRRQADLPEFLRPPPPHARLMAEVRRQGVQLAALYHLPDKDQEHKAR